MSIFADYREDFLRSIFTEIVALREPTARQKSRKNPRTEPYPNFADGDSKPSITLAEGVMSRMPFECASVPPAEQTAGKRFTESVEAFVSACFSRLEHLRPGDWKFTTKQPRELIAQHDQYAHLSIIERLTETNPEIAAVLGKDYFVTPDIVICRVPVSDKEINAVDELLEPDEPIARLTPLRELNVSDDGSGESCNFGVPQIPHAAISCNWTLRSDDAQNAETEALNLISNENGQSQHIVAVTMEPLPRRIASIALGTGGIDCVYHATLYELMATAEEDEQSDLYAFLKQLVDDRRLRDISDLPMDLAI